MISTTNIKVQYSPTTPTDSFPFDIRYFESIDINVEVVDTLGATTILTLDAVTDGFIVTAINGKPENGATITTSETYTTGSTLTIYREVEITQEAEFQRGGDLSPSVLNASLDRGVAISQQLSDDAIRHISVPITDPDGLSYELPTVALRKNKVVGFDDDGNTIAVDVGSGGGLVGVDTSKGLSVSSGIISSTIDNSTIIFNGSGQHKVGTITVDQIGTDAVTTAKILNSNVTKAKIENVADMRVLGNTSGSATAPQEVVVYDQDAMTADSATALATQQSIKAYVDATNAYRLIDAGSTTVYSSALPTSWTELDLSSYLPSTGRFRVNLMVLNSTVATGFRARPSDINAEVGHTAVSVYGGGTSAATINIGAVAFLSLTTDSTGKIDIISNNVSNGAIYLDSYQKLA